MNRSLRYLLLVVALLFSQHAAILHGLAHARHDIALATHDHGKAPPAPDHGLNVCAAFGALAHALGNAVVATSGACVQALAQAAGFHVVLVASRIVFDSRAPPFLV